MARPDISGLRFVTDDVAKVLKKCNIFFAYNARPWGLPPCDLRVYNAVVDIMLTSYGFRDIRGQMATRT